MLRKTVLAAFAALLVLPASALAVPDTWVRWQSGAFTVENQWRDSHVRALDHTWGGRIWAGTEGNAVFTGIAPGLNWGHHAGGLNGAARDIRAFYTPADGTVLAGTGGGLFKSVNEGAWQPLGQGAGANKLNAAVQAITDSGGTLLAGVASGGVWKSGDGGNSWSPTTGMLPAESVWALVRHPAVPNRVFAGTQSGVYRSENGGSTWTLSSDGLPFANVFEIAFDPANPLFMYVATSSAGVYKSMTGGLTWTSANGEDFDTDLGNTSVQSAMAFPGTPGEAPTFFAGTNDGVWLTTNGGEDWGKMSTTGLANPLIRSLAIFPTTPGLLYAGTQAAGVHAIPLQPPNNTSAPAAPSGEAKQGSKLSSYNGTWEGTKPIKYAYKWYECTSDASTASCSPISGATDKTLVLNTDAAVDNGNFVRSRVRAANVVTLGQYVDETWSAPTAAVTGAGANAPNISSLANYPVISPNAASYPVGTTYTVSTGTWDGGAKAPTSYAYQWERCASNGTNCAAIAGATDNTYTSTTVDTEKTLRAQVTATNASGNTTKPSKSITWQVIRAKPVNLSKPTILGDPLTGGTLSSNAGVWKGEDITYFRTWQACEKDGTGCVSIIGATEITYTILGIYEGKRLRLRIEARNGQGNNFVDYAFSDLTAVVSKPAAPPGASPAPAPAPSVAQQAVVSPNPPLVPRAVLPAVLRKPSLSGRARVGKTLTATAGRWSGATRFRFQWLRNGKPIKKATQSRYKLRRKDRRKKVACRITAIGPGGKTTLVTAAKRVR